MRYQNHLIAALTILTVFSCSPEGPLSKEEPSPLDKEVIEQNRWIYSQMNSQYLWRKDLPDSTECDYSLPPKDFFKSILSGKDRFSYIMLNEYYSPRNIQSYGFEYQTYIDKNGTCALQVLYVNSNHAERARIRRGDFLEFIKEEDIGYTFDRLEMRDNLFMKTSETVLINKDKEISSSTVLLDSVYVINNNRIGYLCYLEYKEQKDLKASLTEFVKKNVTDLILDLRYNPGGLVKTCMFLSNCIVSSEGYGGIFQQCSYNDRLARKNKEETNSELTYSYFDAPSSCGGNYLGTELVALNLKRLFVLTSSHTASASEANIICLKPYMEVIQIGETTVGKGVGSWMISDKKYRYAIQPITMRYYNADMETTPDEGLVPDYYIKDGYSVSKKQLGEIEEPLLGKAIQLILETDTSAPAGIQTMNPLHPRPVGEPSFVKKFKNRREVL